MRSIFCFLAIALMSVAIDVRDVAGALAKEVLVDDAQEQVHLIFANEAQFEKGWGLLGFDRTLQSARQPASRVGGYHGQRANLAGGASVELVQELKLLAEERCGGTLSEEASTRFAAAIKNKRHRAKKKLAALEADALGENEGGKWTKKHSYQCRTSFDNVPSRERQIESLFIQLHDIHTIQSLFEELIAKCAKEDGGLPCVKHEDRWFNPDQNNRRLAFAATLTGLQIGSLAKDDGVGPEFLEHARVVFRVVEMVCLESIQVKKGESRCVTEEFMKHLKDGKAAIQGVLELALDSFKRFVGQTFEEYCTMHKKKTKSYEIRTRQTRKICTGSKCKVQCSYLTFDHSPIHILTAPSVMAHSPDCDIETAVWKQKLSTEVGKEMVAQLNLGHDNAKVLKILDEKFGKSDPVFFVFLFFFQSIVFHVVYLLLL